MGVSMIVAGVPSMSKIDGARHALGMLGGVEPEEGES